MLASLGACIEGPLGSGLSERKRRLWACACCRAVWGPISGPKFSAAMDVAERYADGLVSEAEVEAAQRIAEKMTAPLGLVSSGQDHLANHAALLREVVGNPYWPLELPPGPARPHPCSSCGADALQCCQKTRSRCRACGRFGPAWRYVVRAYEPCPWLTPLVVAIATDVYDNRQWDLVGIVADALEEAGCEYRPVLDHLRSPGPHVLGCCALDLLLGKT